MPHLKAVESLIDEAPRDSAVFREILRVVAIDEKTERAVSRTLRQPASAFTVATPRGR